MKLKTITVKPGDTLWGIAERETGDGQNWRIIFGMNVAMLMVGRQAPATITPDFLQVGDQLVVPHDVKFEPSGN